MKSKPKAVRCVAFAVACIALSGCVKVSDEKPLVADAITNASKPYKNPFSESGNEPQDFMNVMHILKCQESGLYQVKTDISIIGNYLTLEEARVSKTNKAIECSKYWKAHPLTGPMETIPDCGERIE